MQLSHIIRSTVVLTAVLALIAAFSVANASAAAPARECTFNPYIKAANTCPSQRVQAHKKNRPVTHAQKNAKTKVQCVNPYMKTGAHCS
jgi:hypothetical protein